MIEVWRPVEGFERLYEVSSAGRVRSLDRAVVDKRGRQQKFTGRTLKLVRKKQTGYVQVSLCDNGVQRQFSVHQLVALAFLGQPESGQEVCHGDADRANNIVSNLRWGTRAENQQEKVTHGNHTKAARTHCPRGHELVEPNLQRAALLSGHRSCLACARTHARMRTPKYAGMDFQVISDSYYVDIVRSAA